jgi:hypothetical protein
MAEADDRELKSEYHDTDEDRLQVVKTLVAMANTRGGTMLLERVSVMPFQFDSARLDDRVNKYVEPRVDGIESEPAGGGMAIRVRESEQKPHVFVADGRYRDKSKDKDVTLFHRGQVWVRHSSKNETATGDDVQRMVRESVSRYLGRLSVQVGEGHLPLALEPAGGGIPVRAARDGVPALFAGRFGEHGDGVAVRLSDEPGAVPVVPDVDRAYPHTNASLSKELARPKGWVSKAAAVLGMREDPALSLPLRNGTGRVALWRYTEKALRVLSERLEADPGWDPSREMPAGRPPDASGPEVR